MAVDCLAQRQVGKRFGPLYQLVLFGRAKQERIGGADGDDASV